MHFVLNIAVCFSVCFVISESVRKNNFSVKSGKTINVSQTLIKRVLADSLIICACVCNAESDCAVGVLKSNGGECSLYSANGVMSLDESTTDTVIVKLDEKDECVCQPCQNGGTYQDSTNEYSCTCSPGFTGDNCQKDVDECASNPCQNGGTCQDGVNKYSCTCRPGFTGGDNCQKVSVSKHKAASQSTTYLLMQTTPLYASYAVDGDVNTFFHTKHEVNPKWWVDLGQQYTVDLVVMRNRADCCGERLANVTVYVGSDTNIGLMEKCAYFPGPGTNAQVIHLHCENKPTGNIVLLSMVNNQHCFNLGEVEVYPLN